MHTLPPRDAASAPGPFSGRLKLSGFQWLYQDQKKYVCPLNNTLFFFKHQVNIRLSLKYQKPHDCCCTPIFINCAGHVWLCVSIFLVGKVSYIEMKFFVRHIQNSLLQNDVGLLMLVHGVLTMWVKCRLVEGPHKMEREHHFGDMRRGTFWHLLMCFVAGVFLSLDSWRARS